MLNVIPSKCIWHDGTRLCCEGHDTRRIVNLTHIVFPCFLDDDLHSLLGQGYNLQELLSVADETSKIRKSRESNMKGRFDTFKKVFNLSSMKPKAKAVGKPVARIVAAKSG